MLIKTYLEILEIWHKFTYLFVNMSFLFLAKYLFNVKTKIDHTCDRN